MSKFHADTVAKAKAAVESGDLKAAGRILAHGVVESDGSATEALKDLVDAAKKDSE
ncbi:hypothetical protein OHB04_22755 [Streptomyces sp. NBC_01775]|uniref:hypothetical protein n=1 Tax=Streptomyces sp. NBC_01775 TaxID=2975939 RepID=UPI002DD95E93|nr:hypothetical protein [Streptomyces sp. NBC_01775]WSB78315.1 hypothetical protein OHB04_22755 [Streptomyces sp. NBC_01775]